jgi:hypothetical protein
VFFCAGCFALAVPVLAVLVKEVPLRGAADGSAAVQPDPTENGEAALSAL